MIEENNQINILLVEDDEQLSELISDYLKNYNYHVDIIQNGDEAYDFITTKQPDLVILDVMLPGADGFEICRSVKPEYDGPILFLTARSEELDQLLGLELGADDYMIKPVTPRILLAKIKALLRRSNQKNITKSSNKLVKTSDIVIDGQRRHVTKADQEVQMSSYEFDLLWLLASKAGEVVSREEIYSTLQGINYDGENRSVDIYVCHIRSKIEANPAKPQLIKTVRSKGYIFVED